MSYELVIRSYNDPEYRHVVAKRESERALERVDAGANINLDHANFYTKIEPAS